MRLLIFFTALCFTTLSTAATFTFSSDAKRTQFNRFLKEIRCVVCQNQSIAESDAPLAQDIQRKIYDQLLLGKSESDIKDYLVTRYGDSILFSPPFNRRTLILWAFPFLLLGGLIFFIFKKNAFYSE